MTSTPAAAPPAGQDAGQDPPAWFAAALADAPVLDEVLVEDVVIRCRTWGQPGAPGIVLVHGGAAHARWWDHLGPLLAGGDRHRVTAVDLSGHGDSGTRTTYGLGIWADEIMAVADHLGMQRPPVVVGHSMGGFVAMHAAAQYGDRLAGAIIVDSPVRRPDPESQEGRSGRVFRRPKTYPTREQAVARFRLYPPQPEPPAYIFRHVAETSVRLTPAGEWRWKFDPMVFVERKDPHPEDFGEILARVRCRIAVVHAELSEIVTPDVTDYMAERLGRTAPFVEIPQAHHHLILDQPLAFTSAIRALLADWEHSIPRRIPGAPSGAAAPP
jgi:pimeloyl-ACP methyl ester carboxylesterase